MHPTPPDSIARLLAIAKRVRGAPKAPESALEDAHFLDSLRSQASQGGGALDNLLQLCSRAAEALPEHADTRLADTLTRALGYAAKFLETDGACGAKVLEEASARLAEVLGAATPARAPAKEPVKVAAPAPVKVAAAAPPKPSNATLDEASSLLLTLGPGDKNDIARLAIMLEGLVQAETDGVQRECLRDAAQQAHLAISSDTQRAQELLERTSQLLECAAKTLQDQAERNIAPARSAAPAQKPAPAPAPLASAAPATPVEIPKGPKFEVLPADADLELLGGFITESRENLEGAEAALLTLEHNPDDIESVNTVFRAFHTVKGSAAFLGLKGLGGFAHKAEGLLSRMREREIRCVDHYAELALLSCDMLKALLDATEKSLETKEIWAPDGVWDLAFLLEHPEEATRHKRKQAAASPGASAEQAIPFDAPAPAPATTQGAAPELTQAQVPAENKTAAEDKSAPRGGQDSGIESTVRVRTDRLDRLINMVGELVIAQSMVAQDDLIRSSSQHDLLKKVGRAGKIVRELQDLSLSLRMVPLKQTFTKMIRIVRDVAHKSGKSALLVTHGEETEIDRNMVDELSDPLVHMVRNAVDHGIEPPDVRLAAGKPAQGTVNLRAYQSGGNVVVEMQDDGRGMSREKLVKKAIEKGLIESDRGMSDAQVYNLVFAPGFSTADKVTDVSGRGVGMDVVRRNIESIKGRVEITTELGQGTTFKIYLPLTLAITDGMLVKVGNERYIVPITSIRLSFRPTEKQLSTISGRGELVMLRGEPIPVVRLHSLLGRSDAVTDPTQGLLVIVEAGHRPLALLVDALLGQYQVVAKTLGERVQRVPGISGGAILGDGSVGLILDPEGLAKLTLAGVETSSRTQQACAPAL